VFLAELSEGSGEGPVSRRNLELFPDRKMNERIIEQIIFKFPVYYDGQEGYEIRLLNEKTVETVALLSQRKPDDRIEVEIELDELDLTSAESKATYAEIKDYVLKEHG